MFEASQANDAVLSIIGACAVGVLIPAVGQVNEALFGCA
jgi:hypothetical protein